MSASLVGSEMCIRDSTSTAISYLADLWIRWAGWWLEEGRRQVFGNLHEAVSYTHLTLPTICSV
eukprot:13392805-Alexandrium_andersonii.AAC.1